MVSRSIMSKSEEQHQVSGPKGKAWSSIAINRKTHHTARTQKAVFPMILKLSKPEAISTFLPAPLRHDSALNIQAEKCVRQVDNM